MKITIYSISADIEKDIKAVFVSDLHGFNNEIVINEIKNQKPDIVLVPGDFIHNNENYREGIEFLKCASQICPTFCSVGNHELRYVGDISTLVKETGAILLDNSHVEFMGIKIGGLTSGFAYGGKQGKFKKTPAPNLDFLRNFSKLDGFKLLLSHHPEYYPRYIKELPIDMILSGHAHGGQWQLFGRGLFAPGQGIFPKYTWGIHDGRFIVSRGLGNPHSIPRINNSPEFIVINLNKAEEKK